MSLARPYAKAIFDLALRDKQFSEWQNALAALSIAAIECKKLRYKPELDLFYSLIKDFSLAINLVRLLSERKKLEILPDVTSEFQRLFFEHEKILEAKIITAFELTSEHKEKLEQALQQRYQHKILLQCQVDNKLIGGAIIYIADQVIDKSIKGTLRRLKQELC